MATTTTMISLLFLLSFISIFTVPALSTEFAVGGDGNWTIPSSHNSEYYNKWASNNRFLIGDTIHFKYKKDSVLVVSEKEYNECGSIHPIFFSNTGKTEFTFEKPGLFYFISGVDGHCEKGEKMIIKVLVGPVSPGTTVPEVSGPAASPDFSKLNLLMMITAAGASVLVLGFY